MTSTEARILVVDNYDSFAYNLVQYVGEVADEVVVRRNDRIDLEDVHDLDPTGIVVSPGPGTPQEAGISIPLFTTSRYPILGVCLGHQALCAANGAPIVHASEIVHGKPSTVSHDGDGIFSGLPETVQVGRYHSLAVGRRDLPDALEETARTTDDRGVLMAVRHRDRPHIGVQFHPESILTRRQDETREGESAGERGQGISLEVGKRMIANFCRFAAAVTDEARSTEETSDEGRS
ncbi:aminodeoxychorismate/anthranilate synthase component II [Natrarchaeobius halalkaliphilus]|uniref:anthranilate synthase n=1 Tax=Natrarchaeobius halalkaliphilus TaxID=1679091 RepID=A0A3N6MBL6_9EURY|nr:aminodeoxychorismate/anthranilate synthase component II [Natrarchaeobius halalkaliphilus]RQG92861.1 aminodeoxychorismate/anthranilate synthase component II [Natrarchaeobius halalkaliphilus]